MKRIVKKPRRPARVARPAKNRPPVKRVTPPTATAGVSDHGRIVAMACGRAADGKLGEDTQVLDVRGLSAVSDYLVITTGTSTPHLKALSDAVAEAIELAGGRLHHIEGDARASWILLDAHAVLVHIFDPVTRRHYDLERLWADARRIPWAGKAPRRSPGGIK